MLRNFKIIIFLLVISTSLIVVKAIGEENKNFQTANISDGVVLQTVAESIGFSGQSGSSVLSDNSISGNLNYLTNIKCGGDLSLSANIAFVRFLSDNSKIYELNTVNHWPIASITKLITAIIAKENIGAMNLITITDQMLLAEGEAGNLKAGEIYKADDLVKTMLLLSSNDAAEALAQSILKNNFVELMNQKAKELNLNETVFFDPTGLSSKNQSTTGDIFKIISYIYQKYPDILKITTQKSQTITEINSKSKKIIKNINEFAGQNDFIGGKTGFIDESQGNLVSMFMIKKDPVAIIVFGSQDRFGDTKKLLECVRNENYIEQVINE